MCTEEGYRIRHSLFTRSESVCSVESACRPTTRRPVRLTDSDTKAALELVFVMVEEGAKDQRERQREQLLF